MQQRFGRFAKRLNRSVQDGWPVLRRWATRRLRTGDLSALARLAGGGQAPQEPCLQRLFFRKFVKRNGSGQPALTLRGQLALMVRRAMEA